jgi:tRNA A-37 threonylcarbamoyl transferase component Bud32
MTNSTARAVVDVGSVIADTYVIEALLGRGGMGAVFLAHHKRLAGKRVAIKILHTEIEDADVVARFKREAEIAAKLNHPNIVGVIDYNVAPDGMPYLVLDYLEGETLAQRIARGPMPLDQVLSILRQIGSALAAAHRAGIVHRDLKPQNIFLVPTEVDGRHLEIAKVLDFGISKIRGSQTVKTQDSALLGTPQYMAPEQATGQHANVDERTDVFALGAIVYEMLSGRPAFSGASIPEVVFKVVYEQPAPLAQQMPALSPAIVGAVTQAMAKPSAERFPTVASFVEAVTGQPLTVTRGQPSSSAAAAAAADSPSAARRVASGEAFAQTMGSGDHADALLATAAPGAVSSSGLGAVGAMGTMRASPTSSASGAPGAIGAAGASPSSSAPGAAAVPTVDMPSLRGGPTRSRPSAGMIAAIVLGAAAVAGGVVLFAKRDSSNAPTDITTTDTKIIDTKATDTRTTDTKTPDTKATDTKATDTKIDTTTTDTKTTDTKIDTTTTDTKTTDTKTTDTKTTDTKAGAKPPNTKTRLDPNKTRPDPRPGDDAEGDEDIKQKLKDATAALDRRDYDQAERIANSVINSPASPRQHATARLIHGTVQCAARNDQEAAGIDLRNLEGFRAMKTRLLTICKRHGIFTAR